MKCPVCGCDQYTKGGNTAGGRWVFVCSNAHTWAAQTITNPFPWRPDDPNNPKYWAWDIQGQWKRKDDPLAIFPAK